MDPIVSVKNVVCTFHLGRPLNLPVIAQAFHARYDPKQFPALVTRARETRAAISMFTTGSVVIVGGQTEQHGIYSARLLVLSLQRDLHFDCDVYNFHICNLVCRVKMPFFVNVEMFHRDHLSPPISNYEPQLFPGMGWKQMVDGEEVTLTLFFEGGGVATGLKTQAQIPAVRDMLLRELMPYKLGSEYRKFTNEEIASIGEKKMKNMHDLYVLSQQQN